MCKETWFGAKLKFTRQIKMFANEKKPDCGQIFFSCDHVEHRLCLNYEIAHRKTLNSRSCKKPILNHFQYFHRGMDTSEKENYFSNRTIAGTKKKTDHNNRATAIRNRCKKWISIEETTKCSIVWFRLIENLFSITISCKTVVSFCRGSHGTQAIWHFRSVALLARAMSHSYHLAL